MKRLLGPLALIALVVVLALAGMVVRARTSHDETVTGTYFGAVPFDLPPDAVPMSVHEVHDGDSMLLTKPNDSWWEQYRIIGVNAPEVSGPYGKEQCFGKDAASFLQTLLPRGATVYIQKDVSDTDRHGRFLRHMFIVPEGTTDAYLLGEILVRGGFAWAHQYPPDDLYDDVLRDAQRAAQSADMGMWNACPTYRR